MPPKFSVVIPAYNQAEFIGATIQSILDQTLQDFEIIVVNDASPDDTNAVVAQIDDPRVRLLIHPENKGLPAARNTGMRAARGEYVALLDSDDLFHPQKLELHAAFLDTHPGVSVTYNSRFNFNYSETTIRDLVRPPATVGLRDFLFGYPFTPSDMVIRRSVIETVGVFDDYFRNGGEDMEYPTSLALAGCKFARVDKALNYRRHHSGRYRKNLDPRLKDVQVALAKVYTDPRCPKELPALGETPLTEHYIVLVYHAFMQNRTEDGQRFLRLLSEMNPGALQGHPCAVTEYFAHNSTADEKDDHTVILRQLFAQLPAELASLNDQLDWAIRRGYLIKAVRNCLWGPEDTAAAYFQKAAEVGARFSDKELNKVAQNLTDCETEMTAGQFQAALKRLMPYLRKHAMPPQFRRFLGEYHAQRAFENYRRQLYRRVPASVLLAIRNEPHYLMNRGIVSILARSVIQR